jgi:hypothetical protein
VIDWDSLYAKAMTALGVTWEYMDEFMTLPRLNALCDHWAQFPPVHIATAAIAAAVGIKFGSSSGAEPLKKIDNLWQGAEVLNDDQWRGIAKPDVPTIYRKLPK